MEFRQADALAKEIVLVSASTILAAIAILWLVDTLRFYFCLVSAFLVLRHICRVVSEKYLVPLRMKRTTSFDKKAVLITGCDTGFGNLLAKRLDKLGFHVFAGCLNPSENGGMELSITSSKYLKVFPLDVSDPQSIEEAVKFVKDNIGDMDLWAVVNNAGVFRDTLFEIMSMKNIESELNINLLGVIRMTKAFLPLVRKCQGARIVNVASAAGRYNIPCMAAYCVSKHGVIAFSESLRMELRKLGVAVVTIEPFAYRTRLSNPDSVKHYAEKSWNSASSDVQSAYKELNAKCRIQKLFDWTSNQNLDDVVNDLTHAVTAEVPNYTYCPGTLFLKLLMWAPIAYLPAPVKDIIYTEIAM